MKRLAAVLAVLVLLMSGAVSALGDDQPQVYSYDFDLRFSLNADVFPVRSRAHMQGYAELLDSLRLKGNITWCPDYDSLDLHMEIIPVSNPDSSIFFRLYGIPSDLALTSPLLGGETIWFDNYVLMEFAVKAWNNLHFPLQYAALLHPYVTVSAFDELTNAWNQHIGAVTQSTEISASVLKDLADAWETQVHSDSRIGYWILALSSAASDHGILEQEFEYLPDYLLKQVSHGGGLSVTVSGNTETWSDSEGNILGSRTVGENTSSLSLSLPATQNGYVPVLSVMSRSSDSLYSLSASGSYNRSPDASIPDETLPESLLDFSASLNSFPTRIQDAAFEGGLRISGLLLPNLNLSLHGEMTESGRLSIVISHPVKRGGQNESVLTCTGTVTAAVPSEIPNHSSREMHQFIRIFGVNDQSMNEFVQRTARPMFNGIMDFLYELPARGCQSIMDDLENYGLLELVLGV